MNENSYDKCFDQWYKDVFLLHKADGKVGCEMEFKVYTDCFHVRTVLTCSVLQKMILIMYVQKELHGNKQLVESIKSVMASDVRARWKAKEDDQSTTE